MLSCVPKPFLQKEEPTAVLLERWRIRYEPLGRPPANVAWQTFYKRFMVLLRSLIAQLRLLPAHRLASSLAKHYDPDRDPEGSRKPSSPLQFAFSLPRAPDKPAPAGLGFAAGAKQFSFPTPDGQHGKLEVGVLYRPVTPFLGRNSPTPGLAVPAHARAVGLEEGSSGGGPGIGLGAAVIQDYMRSPTAQSIPRRLAAVSGAAGDGLAAASSAATGGVRDRRYSVEQVAALTAGLTQLTAEPVQLPPPPQPLPQQTQQQTPQQAPQQAQVPQPAAPQQEVPSFASMDGQRARAHTIGGTTLPPPWPPHHLSHSAHAARPDAAASATAFPTQPASTSTTQAAPWAAPQVAAQAAAPSGRRPRSQSDAAVYAAEVRAMALGVSGIDRPPASTGMLPVPFGPGAGGGAFGASPLATSPPIPLPIGGTGLRATAPPFLDTHPHPLSSSPLLAGGSPFSGPASASATSLAPKPVAQPPLLFPSQPIAASPPSALTAALASGQPHFLGRSPDAAAAPVAVSASRPGSGGASQPGSRGTPTSHVGSPLDGALFPGVRYGSHVGSPSDAALFPLAAAAPPVFGTPQRAQSPAGAASVGHPVFGQSPPAFASSDPHSPHTGAANSSCGASPGGVAAGAAGYRERTVSYSRADELPFQMEDEVDDDFYPGGAGAEADPDGARHRPRCSNKSAEDEAATAEAAIGSLMMEVSAAPSLQLFTAPGRQSPLSRSVDDMTSQLDRLTRTFHATPPQGLGSAATAATAATLPGPGPGAGVHAPSAAAAAGHVAHPPVMMATAPPSMHAVPMGAVPGACDPSAPGGYGGRVNLSYSPAGSPPTQGAAAQMLGAGMSPSSVPMASSPHSASPVPIMPLFGVQQGGAQTRAPSGGGAAGEVLPPNAVGSVATPAPQGNSTEALLSAPAAPLSEAPLFPFAPVQHEE